MTLRQLHTRRSECLGLEGGLDALGNYLQRSCAQQRRQPVQPVRGRLIGSNLTHEQPVDLEKVEVAAREQRQICTGERRVIECNLRAGAGNAVEGIETQLVRYAALGNFEYQLLCMRT